MIIHNPVITGSFQINGNNISSVDSIDNVSSSVAELNDASGSFSDRVTTVEGSVDSLNSASSSYLLNTTDTLDGDLTVTGKITAQEFHTEFVSASIIYESGSTKFGNSYDDTHTFTGSLQVSGSSHYLLGNLGLGIIPSVWEGTVTGLQVQYATVEGRSIHPSFAEYGANTYSVSGTRKYIASDFASRYTQYEGTHYWLSALSGNADDTISFSELMRLTSSGTLGIGVTSPDGQLHIKGSTNKTLKIDPTFSVGEYTVVSFARNGVDKWRIFHPSDDSYLSFYNNQASAHQFTLKSDGTVGIGTSNPTSKLEVAGGGYADIAIKDTGEATDQKIWAQQYGTAVGAGTYRLSALNDAFTAGQNAVIITRTGTNVDTHQFLTSNTERMRITSGGDVLVGLTSRVTGLSGYTQFEVSGAEGGITINSNTTTAGKYSRLMFTKSGATGNEGLIRYNVNDYHMSFWTDATERMRITSGGNVGIGTDSPTSRLQVVGNFEVTNGTKGIRFVDTGVYTEMVADTVLRIAQRTEIWGNANGGYYLDIRNSDSDPQVRLEGNGGPSYFKNNVGIGTTSPGAALDVNSSITRQNGVNTYFAQGYSQGDAALNFDITVNNEGGGGNIFKVEAGFSHYFGMGYNAVAEFWVASRGTTVSVNDVYRYDSTLGGSWTATKPNTTTLRITKNAGTYPGGGRYWVKVTYALY